MKNAYVIPFDVDEYLERRREEWENPKHIDSLDPAPESKWLYLDDVLEDLESRYGCKLSDLPDGDLEDIVIEMTGIYPDSVRYDDRMYGIKYEYKLMEV